MYFSSLVTNLPDNLCSVTSTKRI